MHILQSIYALAHLAHGGHGHTQGASLPPTLQNAVTLGRAQQGVVIQSTNPEAVLWSQIPPQSLPQCVNPLQIRIRLQSARALEWEGGRVIRDSRGKAPALKGALCCVGLGRLWGGRQRIPDADRS